MAALIQSHDLMQLCVCIVTASSHVTTCSFVYVCVCSDRMQSCDHMQLCVCSNRMQLCVCVVTTYKHVISNSVGLQVM